MGRIHLQCFRHPRNIPVSSGRKCYLKRRKIVSNEKKEVNVFERILKLLSAILKMVVDGVRDPNKVAEQLQAIVDEGPTYLRQLFTGLEVDGADGNETFQSSRLFTGGIYGLAVPAAAKGKPTPATKATVCEMILDETFALLFGSLGEGRKRWTEAQVIKFCRKHRDKLRTQGYGTFFEMKGDVVAYVRGLDDGRLFVNVRSLEYNDVWFADYQHRVVVPQL